MFGSSKFRLGSIFFVAVLLRLWKLGTIPVSNVESPFFARLPSATLGIAVVFLIYVLLKKLFKEPGIALWSSFWLAINPWHVTESRIISHANYATTLLITLWMLWLYVPKKIGWIGKVGLVVIFLAGLLVVYPEFWILQRFSTIPISDFTANIFHLISGEFLFFFNDTFWWGGMRETGVMMPIMIGPLFVGIYSLVFSKNKKALHYIAALFAVILAVSAASPFFPESREFFLATPLLTIITGLGTVTLIKWFRRFGKMGVISLSLASLLVLYQFLLFWRLYTVHHSARMKGDIHNVLTDY